MSRDRAIYFAALLAATLLMASSFIAGKALLATGIPSFLLIGWRFVLATLAALPLARLDGPGFLTRLVPSGFGARRWIVLALIGIVQTGGLMGFLFLGLRTISPSTTAILIFTNPIWVALHRPPHPRRAADGAADRRSRLRRSRSGLCARLRSSRR